MENRKPGTLNPSEEELEKAESYLKNLSNSKNDLLYESKQKIRTEFRNFKNTFVIVGSLLCLIIGMIGILNYTNTMISSFLARKREFAVMQAVGMTGNQLRKVWTLESYLNLLTSAIVSLFFCVVLTHPMNSFLERLFWFFKGRFSLASFLIPIPILLMIGWILPNFMYSGIRRESLVERLRE